MLYLKTEIRQPNGTPLATGNCCRLCLAVCNMYVLYVRQMEEKKRKQ